MSAALRDPTAADWYEANQRHLVAALDEVRSRLRARVDAGESEPAEPPARRGRGLEHMPAPAALDTLCTVFGLSEFERGLLLLAAGVELDASFAPLLAGAHGDADRAWPTFGLALHLLPNAHWSALSPMRPLRYWRLVELGSGEGLAARELRIDERILHYLSGVGHLDIRLAGHLRPVDGAAALAASHELLADRIAGALARDTAGATATAQIIGRNAEGRRAIAAAAAVRRGLTLLELDVASAPADPRELEALVRLCIREAALTDALLYADIGDAGGESPARIRTIARDLAGAGATLLVGSEEPLPLGVHPAAAFEVGIPSATERRALWVQALGPAAGRLDGELDVLVTHFDLDPATVHEVCLDAAAEARDSGDASAAFARALWRGCRVRSRPRLERLAQRIETAATRDDLVLPDPQRRQLDEIALHVRRRLAVYETWGFATKGARGLGIGALFSGASGTGKTLAAEVLASELELDLYRIDLSQVVSKYIGETEKNLRRVFDAAEGGGAVLLFDEADALFGKRSEVKDSHDRYANIEVSYLLQRMEGYRGLAILTTNMKSALDAAFMRRLRFVVEFPFPDAAQRARIWGCVFPDAMPRRGLDFELLAQLNVAGGTIRNIALYAAFLAADANEPVGMSHLLRAAQAECAKLERLPSKSEIRGWG